MSEQALPAGLQPRVYLEKESFSTMHTNGVGLS